MSAIDAYINIAYRGYAGIRIWSKSGWTIGELKRVYA